MSDVTISIDANTSRAEAKAKKLSDALDGTGRSWAQAAGQTFSRIGGGAGDMGRFLGVVAGGFSMVSAAAAAAGLGINAYLGLSARAVDAAREQVTWQQRLADAIKQSGQARQDLAAGGLSQVTGLRRLLSRGGTEEGVQRLEKAGFTREDAVQAAGTLRLGKQLSVREGWAAALARTGEMSLAEAAKRIAASVSGSDESGLNLTTVAKHLIEARGERLTPSTLAAGEADMLRSGWGRDNLSEAVRASNQVPNVQAADLLSGATARALDERAQEQLNPRDHALYAVRQEAGKVEESLIAAARAQNRLSSLLASVGQIFGGQGSEREKLARFIQNSAAIRQ